MEYVRAKGLYLGTGTRELLTNAEFTVLEGHRYGLIGANGSGKTTVLNMILGKQEPDQGTITVRPGLRTGYMPQNPQYNDEDSIETCLLDSVSRTLMDMRQLEEDMAGEDEERVRQAMTRYKRVSSTFEQQGGYAALERGEILLSRLGLENSMDQRMGTLSGGERSMVFFARALLSNPQLLILDEPGNHLDFLGLAWMEQFIGSYPGTVIIVSHNRYLLERTCSHLLELFSGTLTEFKGSYSEYRLEKYRSGLVRQRQFESEQRDIQALEKRVRQLQSVASSQNNPRATLMRELGSTSAKLSRLKEQQQSSAELEDRAIQIDFGEHMSRSDIALRMKGFSLSWGSVNLIEPSDLVICCREKVALVGPNGSGKSSLVKAILKSREEDNPGLRVGPGQTTGYMSQTVSFHEGAVTVFDEVRSWGSIPDSGVYGLIAGFSFRYTDLHKTLSVLSGGERNRLQLARLMYLNTNFLILDEPTNHMDIQSREMTEEALQKFPGTVLVVSHDRYFLDKLVTRVIEIDRGRLVNHEGNFSDFFASRYQTLPRRTGKPGLKPGKHEQGRQNSGRKSHSTSLLEQRIQREENSKLQLEADMKAALQSGNTREGLKAAEKLKQLNARLGKLYNQWERETE